MHLRTIAAVLGASGIGIGAFGAHGLKDRLSTGSSKLDNWKTAVMYQLVNAVAILSISLLCDQHRDPQSKAGTYAGRRSDASSLERAGQIMALGTTLFSGSIYLLCLDVGFKKLLGPTTPVGGLLMIVGWTMLGL